VSDLADLLCATLAVEIAESGIDVFAVTSPATVAAGLAARELGAPDLALAVGFTALDGAPIPAVSLGEAGLLRDGPAVRDHAIDTFVLLRRGRVGVATAPAQLDAAGRTNLSGIGEPGRPKVALPGARGLPDNNGSPSRVWYLLGTHGPRQLVERVDVVCGPVPAPGAVRRLLTPAGLFELGAGGWRARWLTPAGPELVAGAPCLGVELSDDEPVVERPDAAALEAVRRVDPHDVRAIEFASGREAGELWARAAAREGGG
jgi:acyl CoA:acetate/3-ketoacid CoA transferase beta subunit